MMYSLAERTEIVLLYGKNNKSSRRTAAAFNEIHPEKMVSHRYVLNLIQKFLQTGSVLNKKRENARVLDEVTQIEIAGNFVMDPCSSIRKVSSLTQVSIGSVHKVLKTNKFHPYKFKIVQELYEDDFDRRIEFCETMTEKIIRHEIFTKNICFTDECTFYLNGFANQQNYRYWDTENPHLYREAYTQKPEKTNVWAGILGDEIVGPVFINENLNGELYLQLLQNIIDPLITVSLENQQDEQGNPFINEDGLFFQQDGAPAHFILPVREWLNERFPFKWIGRRGPIEWPARSPDLAPLDFFLWGYLKTAVYKTQPLDIVDLKNRIIGECRKIRKETFHNVRKEFENRLYHCLAISGGHFEHLIK